MLLSYCLSSPVQSICDKDLVMDHVKSVTNRVMGLIDPIHSFLSTIDARDAAFLTALLVGAPFSWAVTSGGPPGGVPFKGRDPRR